MPGRKMWSDRVQVVQGDGCDMDEPRTNDEPLDERISQLFHTLHRLVVGPTFSYRLGEVRAITDQLVECWARYRWGQGQAKGRVPRPLGLPVTRHPVQFPYTWQEFHALYTVARQADVERGGRYDVQHLAINLWTQPWPQIWTDPLTQESAFSSAASPRPWRRGLLARSRWCVRRDTPEQEGNDFSQKPRRTASAVDIQQAIRRRWP